MWVIDSEHWLCSVDLEGHVRRRALPHGLVPQQVVVTTAGDVLVQCGAGGAAGSMVIALQDEGEVTLLSDFAPRLRTFSAAHVGEIWIVDGRGDVWSFDTAAQRATRRGERAEEISVGVDGSVWIISDERRWSGRVVKRRDPADGTWFSLPAPASAIKAAVAPDGTAWTISGSGEVWRLHPGGAGNYAECQVDAACQECLFRVSVGRAWRSQSGDGTPW